MRGAYGPTSGATTRFTGPRILRRLVGEVRPRGEDRGGVTGDRQRGPGWGRPDVVTDAPDLPALQQRLVDFAAARRWQPFHTPKNLAAALSVEASELLEIFQWLTPEQSAAVMTEEETAFRVRDEVADVLAYLLQFCDALDIDVLAALDAKIDRNELRFPRPDTPTG